MIVVDQSTPLRKGEPPQSPNSPPPPPPAYNGYQSTSYIPVVIPVEARREPARKRFLKAFLVAILIWTLVGIFTRTVVEVFSHHGSRWMVPQDNDWSHWPSPLPVPVEGSEQVSKCVQGAGWTPIEGHTPPPVREGGYWAKTELELSLEDNALFFFARGALASGDFHVVESSDVDDVKVNINVYYYSTAALARASVCTLHRGSHEKGVGIFTPVRWEFPKGSRDKDMLRFFVTVTLPSTVGSTRSIRGLETSFSIFPQRLDDLTAFDFGSVSLRTSNSPISVESIVAHDLTAISSNGPVTGKFNTSTSLVIHTSNSPIKIEVIARNDDKKNKPTTVSLLTSNGVIHADLALVANTSSKNGGAFEVTARSSNGPVEIITSDSPADSILNLDARTSNSPARVWLHPAYEGSFYLASSNFNPTVVRAPDVEDPSGRRRERRFEVNSLHRQVLLGNVAWIPSEHEKGKAGTVSVTSSNSPVVLNL